MGPWMTAMHLFGDKCKTKCCHSTTAFTFPMSISINTELWNRKTSQNAWAVVQCPVDKVWSNKHSTVTQPHSATYFWQTECDAFEICQIRGKIKTLHIVAARKLWNVRHNSIGWLWHTHYTCIHGRNSLIHVKLCCALVLCLFWAGCCAAWGHNCFSVPSLPPILHEKSIMVDTSLIPFIYFVSGRCISKRAKMSALPNVSQINDIPARMGAPWRVS